MNKIPELTLEFEKIDTGFTFRANSIIKDKYFFIEKQSEHYFAFYGHKDDPFYKVFLAKIDTFGSLDEAKLACEQYQQNLYLNCLELADIQGLLTKEASLDLKPDNYIEWDKKECKTAYKGDFKFGSKIAFFVIYFLGAEIVYKYDNEDYSDDNEQPYIVKPIRNGNRFENLEQAKQHCQNWLDDYLKGRNE